jgi:hypothetical protein
VQECACRETRGEVSHDADGRAWTCLAVVRTYRAREDERRYMGTSVCRMDACVQPPPLKAHERPAVLGLAPASQAGQGKANGALITCQVFAAYLGLSTPAGAANNRKAGAALSTPDGALPLWPLLPWMSISIPRRTEVIANSFLVLFPAACPPSATRAFYPSARLISALSLVPRLQRCLSTPSLLPL